MLITHINFNAVDTITIQIDANDRQTRSDHKNIIDLFRRRSNSNISRTHSQRIWSILWFSRSKIHEISLTFRCDAIAETKPTEAFPILVTGDRQLFSCSITSITGTFDHQITESLWNNRKLFVSPNRNEFMVNLFSPLDFVASTGRPMWWFVDLSKIACPNVERTSRTGKTPNTHWVKTVEQIHLIWIHPNRLTNRSLNTTLTAIALDSAAFSLSLSRRQRDALNAKPQPQLCCSEFFRFSLLFCL